VARALVPEWSNSRQRTPAAFDQLEIKDEVRPLIMKENAVRLLRLR